MTAALPAPGLDCSLLERLTAVAAENARLRTRVAELEALLAPRTEACGCVVTDRGASVRTVHVGCRTHNSLGGPLDLDDIAYLLAGDEDGGSQA